VRAGGVELALNDAQRSALAASTSLLYGLRPENVTLADHGVPGKVIMVEPTGPETYALIDTALGHLLARAPGRLALHSGDAVQLAWRAEDVHLFDAKSELRVA
jgi:multiple sugar transport system ATP-binding protein